MVFSFDDINPLLTFIGTIFGILVPIGGMIVWASKKATKAALIVEKRVDAKIDQTDKENLRRIEDNKQMIANVQQNLCDQIKYSSDKITDRIHHSDQKTDEIIHVIEKIDDKLDKHADIATRNSARIDSHDERLDNLEHRIYKTASSR